MEKSRIVSKNDIQKELEKSLKSLYLNLKEENVKDYYLLDGLLRECQSVFDKSKTGDYSTIVMLGRNGTGKTFFLNLLVRMTMLKNYPDFESRSRILKNAIYEFHPMVIDIASDCEYSTEQVSKYLMDQSRDTERFYEELLFDAKMKSEEDEVEKIFSNYCFTSNLKIDEKKLLDKHSFIFGCGNFFDRTTTVPLYIRFAYIPSFSIEFYDYDKIPLPDGVSLE